MDIIGIVMLLASASGILWCVYHLGENEGYECGRIVGYGSGYAAAYEVYKSALDDMYERVRREWSK